MAGLGRAVHRDARTAAPHSQMITTLDSNGILLEGAQQRICSPVGLDLGGEIPEEIALAIVAEVQAVYAGRQAGFLTQRRSPLHSRPAAGLKESVTRL
jgi:xanthine/CO dehydrogenase XdhC/CoxF family maturation factor